MGDWFNEAARPALNWWAVIVSGLAAFAVGAVWYNAKVFGAEWMKLTGLSEAKAQSANVGMIMGGALVLTVLIAYSIARLMVMGGGWQAGAKVGLFVGAAIAFATGVNYLFEMKPLKLWFINAGHQVATSVLIGAIIGAWR
jgi:hypothetical protein